MEDYATMAKAAADTGKPHLPVVSDSARIQIDIHDGGSPGIGESLAVFLSTVLLILTFPISVFFCFRVVTEYERAIIFRLGRLRSGEAKGPGMIFLLPCTDSYINVDLRTHTFNVPPQDILTRDSVTVAVDAVVFYRVQDPKKAVVCVSDYSEATRFLAATTLRNNMGIHSLSEILASREVLARSMQIILDKTTESWGIIVERVEIKDVVLPRNLQRAMAAEAEAAREARAKVISAEGEMKAARTLMEASNILTDSPASLQLRYLQTLTTISAEQNYTIVFPLPMDLISAAMKK